jgi:hypothetical protein
VIQGYREALSTVQLELMRRGCGTEQWYTCQLSLVVAGCLLLCNS